MEEAKCYPHRSARNPVLLVLQTSKCKQVTHLNKRRVPKVLPVSSVELPTVTTGWPFNSAGVAEEVARERATGPAGAQQSGSSIWGQERNDSERSLNAERREPPRASHGRLSVTVPFLGVHLDVPAMASFCGRETGLEAITPRELGIYILHFG